MTKFIIILLAALLLEAVGVVYLSRGLKQIGEVERVTVGEIIRLIRTGATNGSILLGVLLEAIFFGALLYMLSQRDVSLIWPLTALSGLVSTLAAKLINHEEVSGVRWAGVTLIVLGAMLVTWSEKQKENRTKIAETEIAPAR